MTHRPFLVVLALVAIASLAAGVALAFGGYSSAGAFAVASACVGVLGVLAGEEVRNGRGNS